MDSNDREALEMLALRWLEARPCEGRANLRTSAEPVVVPASLAALVAATKLREQTLEDARFWLALPGPGAPGLVCVLLNEDEIAPAPGGGRMLKPARFAVSWAEGVDPAGPRTAPREVTLAELAGGRGLWRVVALWTKAERKENADHRAAVAALAARLEAGR